MADQFSDFVKQNSPTPGTSIPTPGVPSAAPTATGGGDAFSQFVASQTQSQPQAASPTPAASPSLSDGGDEFAKFVASQGNSQAPSESSRTGSYVPSEHDESDRFTQEDPGANWLQKAWSFGNKPLTESLFGWGDYRHGAGGFERGTEKILSGLTSPLSLVMLAAFAPAGALEGVAGSALKEGLTQGGSLLGEEALDAVSAASKVESYAKAVQAAKDAQLSGNSIEQATSKFLPYQEFLNYGQYLKNQGMKETDILGESLARRVASQSLRKVGLTDQKALQVAKGAETLVNAGFGVQQLTGAIYAYPRVMDLLSQGDYDDAAEYMVEAGAGTIFGTLGLAHGLHSISDIVPSVNEKFNLPLSDEAVVIERALGNMRGEIGNAQSLAADQARGHLADIMELANVPVPAGLRKRVPFLPEEQTRLDDLENLGVLNKQQKQELQDLQDKKTLSQTRAEQTSFGAELESAVRGILVNKEQRERLLQKQKDFFAALDTGNDRTASYQQAVALREGYNLTDWFNAQGWDFGPPERTADDIATEEKNAVLDVRANASLNAEKISGLQQDLALANVDLKNSTSENANEIRSRIEAIRDQINTSQLEQERLDQKYQEARDWEDPDKQELAFRRLYDHHVQAIKEAAESTPWDTPNAKELFYEKVRALGNYPQDLSLIEEKYPHFKEGLPPIDSAAGDAPRGAYLYNPQYYTERLKDPELVQKATDVQTPHGVAIAVPVGGDRISGTLDYVFSQDEKQDAEKAVEQLKEENERRKTYANYGKPVDDGNGGEFPNPRVVQTGRKSFEVHWGEDLAGSLSKNEVIQSFNTQRMKAEENYEIAQSRQEVEASTLQQMHEGLKNSNLQLEALKKRLDDPSYSEGDHYGAREATKQHIKLLEEEVQRIEKSITDQERWHTLAFERMEAAEKVRDEAVKTHEEALKGKVDESKILSEDVAASKGRMLGYNQDAINEFIDENKNFFAGPNIEAAKKFTLTQKFKNWFRNSRVVDHNNDPLVVYHGTTKDWDTFDPKKAFSGASLGFHAGSLSQARDFVRDKVSPSGEAPLANGRIMPVFLSIQNPLRIDDLGIWRPERVLDFIGARLGITDERQLRDSDKPDYISSGAWSTISDPQKKMLVAVDESLKKEIEEGKLAKPDIASIHYTDEKERYRQRQEELRNQYAINLIKDHGYDGMVYKNIAEGKTSYGPQSTFTSGDSYIAFDPTQIKSATGNNGQFDREIPSILGNRVYPPDLPESEKKAVLKKMDSLVKFAENIDKELEKAGMFRAKKSPPEGYLEKLVLDIFNEKRPSNGWTTIQPGESAPRFTQDEIETIERDPVGFLGAGYYNRINSALDEDGYKGWYYDKGRLSFRQETTPEYEAVMKKYGKAAEQIKQLEKKYNKGVAGDYIGEVHKLPDGAKVLYAPIATMAKINHALNDSTKIIDYGNHIPRQSVDYAIAKMRQAKNPHNDLIRLLDEARNEVGDVVLSRDAEAHPGSISKRLHTLREELIHAWQGRFAKTVASWQLDPKDYTELKEEIPSGMVKHLKDYKYDTTPTTMVTEASAKMMAVKDLSELGVTPEEAAEFLHKYFERVKEKHGESAFDTLVHTTLFGKRVKEEFLNGYKTGPESEPVPGEDEGALAGVGAGGAGGTTEGPPGGEPPQPPEPFDWRKYFGPESNGILGDLFKTEPWQTGPQHPSLPANLVERVNKAKAINHTAEDTAYVQSMIRAYMHVAMGLSPKELELYKSLRKADDDNWTTGYNNGIIHSIVPNHIHHMWGEDPKKGYPAEAEARSGAFAINASQARHRAWGTAFEGILDGRKLSVHDPSAIIAHDADEIAQAAGHRKAIELLLKGVKGSDGKYTTLKDVEGMPIGFLRGMGREVPSPDGTKSSVLVNPNVVKDIRMLPDDVRRLKDSGLLDTYLKDSRVKDITPQVGQGNVKEWILATQKKLQKLAEANPLLSTVAERKQHEEGWEQLNTFTRSQAENIADYLEEALQKLHDAGPIDAKRNYAPLPEEDRPQYIKMAKYLGDVLHGKNKRITPADMQRLEDYAERNRNYAQGLSGSGETEIRPHEVARLALQEREHMSEALESYLDKLHDTFGKKNDDGSWSRKGINSAILHVAHAAENKEFPQLYRDLADLKSVDNMYTSVNPISQALHKEEAQKLLQDINDRQPKQYVWSPKGHITIDHPSFHGYKWMATSADGTPTLAESDMAISRHFYKYVINSLGLKPSWLREEEGLGKVTSALLKGGAQIKSTILSGSPFHVIQIALRAVMLHVNPFVRPNPISDLHEPFDVGNGKTSTLERGVANSLTMFTDKNQAEDHSVGVASHGGWVSKIPIYGPISDQIHDFLFNRLIPSVKAGAYKEMYRQYAQAHPDWTEDAIAYRAAQHTNNAFGGVNWREMGRSATTQDWFNLVALAPDWLESEMRFGAGLFNGWGIGPGKYQREPGKNFTRTQVAQAAAVLWTTARLVNTLYSGKPHYESPFGLVVKDKDGRDVEYSVRTLPTDILHAATDPYGFLMGRTSPLLRSGTEIVTGRNQYGQKLSDSEKYVDLLSNLSPIWGQAGFKKVSKLSTAGDVGNVQQVVKALGGTAEIHRTPAERTAANLAAERSEGGAINPAQIARHRLLLELEQNVRDRRITNQDLQTMVDQGTLPEADAKAVVKIAKETTGLDPEQARMYSRTSRLDFAGAEQVYRDANPSEKAVLHDLIVKKAKAYVKKSLTEETPQTRAVDPMFKLARRYAPLIPEPENNQ